MCGVLVVCGLCDVCAVCVCVNSEYVCMHGCVSSYWHIQNDTCNGRSTAGDLGVPPVRVYVCVCVGPLLVQLVSPWSHEKRHGRRHQDNTQGCDSQVPGSVVR